MKILMVDQYGHTGGAQKCLLDLISGWPAGGTITVAAPRPGPLLDEARKSGCRTVEIPCGPYSEGGKKTGEMARFGRDAFRQRTILRRIIQNWRPDAVYVNGPRVLPGAALAAHGRCPVVFHLHNRLVRGKEIAMVRASLRFCGAQAIACCDYVAQCMAGEKVSTIPNGVPDAGFRLRTVPHGEPWHIGMVGRISPDKGHLLLFEAARRLQAEGRRIVLTIAGDSLYSAAEHAREVRARARGLDVRFRGWVQKVGPLVNEFDLMAVPSIAEPGLPRVVLEAFSAGLPVVALPTGGIGEAVRDRETGFLGSEATATALAEKLREAMDCPPESLNRIVRQARAEWERHWNVDRWRREVMAAIRASARQWKGSLDTPVSSASSELRSSERA